MSTKTDYCCYEEHSNDMASEISRLMALKYEAGQKEHGGELWKKPMLNHMEAEIVDLVHYYLTHKAQMEEATKLLRMCKRYPGSLVTKAYNILAFGNKDGAPIEELAPDTWKHEENCPCPPVSGDDDSLVDPDQQLGYGLPMPRILYDEPPCEITLEDAMEDNEPEWKSEKAFIPGNLEWQPTAHQNEQMDVVLDGLDEILQVIFPDTEFHVRINVV